MLIACSAGALVVGGTGRLAGRLDEVAWMAVSCVPLLWRSRWPLPAAIAALGVCLAAMVLTPGFSLAPAASVVALYTLATRAPQRVTWAAGLAATAAITVTHTLVHPQPGMLGATLVTVDFVAMAPVIGVVVRAHRARLAEAEARADRAEHAVAFLPAPGGRAARLAALTPREREVMALIARGLTNDEIAERLVLARVTVKTHANRAMTKLGAKDRSQLVVLAYETHLVSPQP